MLISQCYFDGPSTGPAEANGLPEAHGPRGHYTPPLGGPAYCIYCTCNCIFQVWIFLCLRVLVHE